MKTTPASLWEVNKVSKYYIINYVRLGNMFVLKGDAVQILNKPDTTGSCQ